MRAVLKALCTAAAIIAVGVFMSGRADVQAQTQGVGPTLAGMIIDQTDAQLRAEWSASDFANAQPLDLRAAYNPQAAAPQLSGTPVQTLGAAPSSIAAGDNSNFLYDPSDAAAPSLAPLLDAPNAFGTSGLRFSSSRNTPSNSATDNAYPNRTIGKLFFKDPANNSFVCSASVIRHRIVATAGHCVHSGNGSPTGWYHAWVFVPSFRSGVAPFGNWIAATVFTTTTWYAGGGGVPNAADYAMLEMRDNAAGQRIGANITGFLGWITNSLLGNHVHMMGYPCNLDSCNIMHQVSAGSGPANGNNTVIYGSDARGGSSGGPWIQNFGENYVCTSGCTANSAGRLQVTAVTSYGPVATTPLYQGASIPDSRWVAVYNAVCAHRVGNCS